MLPGGLDSGWELEHGSSARHIDPHERMHYCSRCSVHVAGFAEAWKEAGSAHRAGPHGSPAAAAGAIAQKHCAVEGGVAGDVGFQVESGIAGKSR